MAEFRKLFKKTAAGKEPEKGPSHTGRAVDEMSQMRGTGV